MTCPVCGADFEPRTHLSKTCSDVCSYQQSLVRGKERHRRAKAGLSSPRPRNVGASDAHIAKRTAEILAQAPAGWRRVTAGDCAETTPPAVATGTRRE